MIEKKQEYARKCKEYERQKTEELQEMKELADAEKASNVQKFENAEKNISRSKDEVIKNNAITRNFRQRLAKNNRHNKSLVDSAALRGSFSGWSRFKI